MSIKGYKFYIRPDTDPESEWVAVSNIPQTDPDYQFTDLTADTPYEISAVAVDMAGNESEMAVPLAVRTPAHDPSEDPLSADDAAAIDAIMTSRKAPAFGALVATSGPKGSYSKAYGKNYTGGSTPTAGADLTLDDKMRYGSNTKMYTAVLIWRQIDLGHLSLDDTLDQFEPGIFNASKITVRHLLQQRSGLPEAFGYGSAIGMQNGINFFLHPTSVCNVMALVRGACTYSNFEPGTSYEYANTNYIVLGHILELLDVEHGTSRPIHMIMREDLIAELGLTETEWPTPNSADGYYMTAPFSRGYMDNPAWGQMVQTVNSLPLAWLLGAIYWALVPALSGGWPATPYMEMTAGNTEFGGAAGCLGGTIDDLLKFGKALARGDLISAESQQIRAEEFCTYTRFTPTEPANGNGWMGAGLGIMSWGDWRGWIGAWLGYNTCCWYNDKTEAVIVTGVNWYTGPSWELFMRVAYQLYPESLARPEWTMRQSEMSTAADEFGTGTLWRWHAVGDDNGTATLPHNVPFYL